MKTSSVFMLVFLLAAIGCSMENEPTINGQASTDDYRSSIITPQEAASRASKAFNDFFKVSSRSVRSSEVSAYSHAPQSRSADNSPSLYIVNFDDGGYAVIGARRDDPTLYIVSDEGSFSLENSPVLELFLNEYSAASSNKPGRRDTFDLTQKFIFDQPSGFYPHVQDNKYIEHRYTIDSIIDYSVPTKWERKFLYDDCSKYLNTESRGYFDGDSLIFSQSVVAIGQILTSLKQSIDNRNFHWGEMTEYPIFTDLSDIGKSDVMQMLTSLQDTANSKDGSSDNQQKRGYEELFYILDNKLIDHITTTSTKESIEAATSRRFVIVPVGSKTEVEDVFFVDAVRITNDVRDLHLQNDFENCIPYSFNERTYMKFKSCPESADKMVNAFFIMKEYFRIPAEESYNHETIIEENYFHSFSINSNFYVTSIFFIINTPA